MTTGAPAVPRTPLARYATRFDVTEINSTFYRPHQLRTFERWAASVPATFRFSAKLPKTITHEVRLLGTGDALTAFSTAFQDSDGSWAESLCSCRRAWRSMPGRPIASSRCCDGDAPPRSPANHGIRAGSYRRSTCSGSATRSPGSLRTLEELAAALRRHGKARSPAWCILDNTAHGHAMEDAARL